MITPRTAIRSLFAVPLLCAACRGAPDKMSFSVESDTVAVLAGGQPVATYVFRDSRIPRPYFKDLFAPGAVRISRHHPPREGLDRTDHEEFHPGLWLAFGELGGADFWRNKARVEHSGFVAEPKARGDRGAFTVRNRYVDGNETICEEKCTYTFVVRPSGYLILWESTFSTERPDVYFGDQEEMGLGLRVTSDLMVAPLNGKGGGGRILDAKGRRNERGVWGHESLWCDLSGTTGAFFAGATIMADPRNPHPCRWHARDYGFVAANPFSLKAFKAGPPRRTKLPLRIAFGILLHAGAAGAEPDLAAAYRDYLRIAEESR